MKSNKQLKITVIDNYDSFVYNLCDYMSRNKNVCVTVYRNDEKSVADILNESPDGVVISPGPGRPEDAGISISLIKKLPTDIPLLGVCLGHQALAVAFGGKVLRADRILHGKTSLIHHNGKDIFNRLDNPFEATRYHSLIVDEKTLPPVLKITATSEKKEIMAIKHSKYPFYGVQFHPESILTLCGLKLIENFLNIVEQLKYEK